MSAHKKNLRRAFQFFMEHAVYVVGEHAKGALHLARAELEAQDRGWRFKWESDQDADLGDHAYWCADERKRLAAADGRPVDEPHRHRPNPRRESWCDHRVEWAAVCEIDDETDRDSVLASLGGTIDASDTYRRVVEAELALEALTIERAARLVEEKNVRETAAIMHL